MEQRHTESKDDNKQWIFQQVNHIFEPLMLSIVREKPADNVSAGLSDSFAD
jgi:hypothetical protein